jgi:dTDP-6-deoxy-L-talose 4-dehydrogenase (NAD+)
MRTVLVTGACGFLGRHLVAFLRGLPGVRVVAAGRDGERLKTLGVEYAVWDLAQEQKEGYRRFGRPDTLIHLAWDGLNHYHDPAHLDTNLTQSYRFITSMVRQGVSSVAVAGTCYEYGLQSGCLSEEAAPAPTTCYARAKDELRRLLEEACRLDPFRLCWGRIFFLHGPGQNPKSLLPQLDRAIACGAERFDMSGGEQLRDYLAVQEAAALLAKLALQRSCAGIFNICSGVPVSVRHLVEGRIAAQGSQLLLNLGAYPYPEHEPMAYWGDATRSSLAAKAFNEEYFHA